MCKPGGEYLQLLREVAIDDMDHGNFVTLDRINLGFLVEERILTFSGIEIMNWYPKYACYATSEEG